MSDPLEGTPYRALRPLGAGSMGEVIEAEHTGLGRRVVVKLLHKRYFAGGPQEDLAQLADRMRLEGQALGAIEHVHVVAALDCGVTPGGRPYLVMERLVGRTLREELDARGPLPVDEALDLAAQALDGLAAVHQAGLVHRDVKPDNLFLCDPAPGRGRIVKLLDLGVAKIVAASSASPSPLAVPTAEGIAMGTPRYFSPEQAIGAPLDGRSDVYSMGLVLHALVTGRTPFDHMRETAALLRAHAESAPHPLSLHAPSPPPPDLEAAVSRALAKRPADRFPSAAAFAAELRRIAKQRPATRADLAKLFAAVLVVAFVASLAVSMLALD
jgi:eukaryotic-like serine/threonine-protein kinase